MGEMAATESLSDLYWRLWKMHRWLLEEVLPRLPEDDPLRAKIERVDNRLEEAAMAHAYLAELADKMAALDTRDRRYLDLLGELLEEMQRVRESLEAELFEILDCLARIMFDHLRRLSRAAIGGAVAGPVPTAPRPGG